MKIGLTEQFRNVIRDCGHSRYWLAKESHGRLHQSELAGFLKGRNCLSLRKLEIVAELVGPVEVRRNNKA